MPHENRIMAYRGQLVEIPDVWSFKWPYHAKVMNTFETKRSRTVNIIELISDVILKIVAKLVGVCK